MHRWEGYDDATCNTRALYLCNKSPRSLHQEPCTSDVYTGPSLISSVVCISVCAWRRPAHDQRGDDLEKNIMATNNRRTADDQHGEDMC
mmetsp:Transcript_98449/g.144137  ORF Transcript_98449/g.144137 Transcript_98449/m.144137 type:complete len:89 (+) Transcript_98449:431-697(+)